jgi:hypothetical protein
LQNWCVFAKYRCKHTRHMNHGRRTGWGKMRMKIYNEITSHKREKEKQKVFFGFVSFGELYVVSGINVKSSFI